MDKTIAREDESGGKCVFLFVCMSGQINQIEHLILTVEDTVEVLEQELQVHLQDGRRGERLRDGVHIVIAGPTNAGKSSLLNHLCEGEQCWGD